ncbi:MAG: SpoIVB peptidase [Clostridiaceae bacterium]|nr:SpoIVB peptidase [Clostridiaceae bacterium]
MNKKRYQKTVGLLMSIFMIVTLYIFFVEITGGLNREYNISIGDNYTLNQRFPILLSTTDSNENSIVEIIQLNHSKSRFSKSLQLNTIDKGTTSLQLKVLGLIPYRNIRVNVVPELQVMPGGQSIGVKLNTDGVLVVGTTQIIDQEGKHHDLAQEAGIRIGDSLISINNIKVNDAVHVGEIIKDSYGEKLQLVLKRDSKKYTTSISPIQSIEDNKYRVGLWVRDKTAGVGTMTFYHPETKKFGALGHAITDVDTGSLLSIKDGEVVRSRVISVQQGKRGKPGEIRGIFYDTNDPIGKLEKNTNFGVYGELLDDLENQIINTPLPVAYQHEIKEGPAHILTTVESNKMERYNIEILKVNNQSKANSKSMVIKVTDEKLLEKTGGIVQGMSGSPIIQDGKIIGAVTHVLINNPTQGYGIFIEWMIEESGIYDKIFKKVVEN